MNSPTGIGFNLLVCFLSIQLLSACSVYKSSGRKQFEDATPGKLKAQSEIQSQTQGQNETAAVNKKCFTFQIATSKIFLQKKFTLETLCEDTNEIQ